MRAGEVVLSAGTELKPGAPRRAGVGRPGQARVVRPRVAVVSTGDELVEPDCVPGPGQIRNSNAIMLRALATRGRRPRPSVLPIAPDEPTALREILRRGLEADVLLITGGVSAGQRDLVPEALESLGVRRVFHKVRLKPGKPIWFGVGPTRPRKRASRETRARIGPAPWSSGCPGNPVSGLVGYLLFVRPGAGRPVAPARPAVGPSSRAAVAALPAPRRPADLLPGAARPRLRTPTPARRGSRPWTGPARPTCGPWRWPTASPPSPPGTAITTPGEIVDFVRLVISHWSAGHLQVMSRTKLTA